MSNLEIKPIEIEDLRKMDLSNSEVSLKLDGTLLYYIDGDLISARGINRNDRYSHILKILKDNNFPNCFGEMFIPNGNVLDINSKLNWKKAFYMPIDLFKSPLNYFERQKVITEKVREINNPLITQKVIFEDVNTAYQYVVDNKSEGLVIVKNGKMYKWKILQELKIKIKEHEAGKDKGTFITEDNNRISGTSMEFVGIYEFLKNKGEDVYAECEYAFKTNEGKMFQARLRRIGTKQEILGK